ncbi:hypothetical protein, partial [Shewanella algae]
MAPKLSKSTCAIGWPPYNAHPLTGTMEVNSQIIQGWRQNSDKKLLDELKGKRRIRSPDPMGSIVVLLFNNLSSNLCGHSQALRNRQND